MSLFDYPTRPVKNVKPNAYLGQTCAPIVAQFDSEESVESAVANMPNRAGQRERVFAYLSEHPSTDEQVQDALGLDPNTQRPRRVELARAGRIKKVGVGRTRSGRSAAIWGQA